MSLQNFHPLVSFGVPFKALSYQVCKSLEEIQAYLECCEKPVYILGGGSNILPVGYVSAHLLKADIQGIEYEVDDEKVFVTAGAGVNWHELVLDTLDKGYSGLENLSLIPGNVGAAPIQNIGAYGVELQDVLVEVAVVDIQTGIAFTLGLGECDFGYRDSIFKNDLNGQVLISHVTFQLNTKPNLQLSYGVLAEEIAKKTVTPTAKDVSNAVIDIRQSKLPDPKILGNAGSFFKNPVVNESTLQALKKEFPGLVAYPQEEGIKLAAGWLIDQCGLKGYRKGDAGVHEHQALVIVNHGQAKAEELLEVAGHVQRAVHNKFGVLLQPEVQIFGDAELIQRSGLILDI